MISLFLLYLLFSREGFHKVGNYAHHQITDSFFRGTKAITAPIPNFAFLLLHLFKGTDKMCDCETDIDFLQPVLYESNRTTIGVRDNVPIIEFITYALKHIIWSKSAEAM